MANYAEIIDGKVSQVIVYNGDDLEAIAWLNVHISTNEWIRTKEDGSNLEKYAGIGDEYHPELNAFVYKPFDSWLLDEGRKIYLPPIIKPIAIPVGYIVYWSEVALRWLQIKQRAL